MITKRTITTIPSASGLRMSTTPLPTTTLLLLLNNMVEDLDGDGTEDHYDLDIDGDGLSNADELLYNSDPWDASSSNRPPSDINASNLTIAENSAIGTVIGEFNATDPDGEGNFTFSINSDSLLLWLPFDERNGTHAENMGSANTYGALMNGAVFSTDEAKFGPSSIRVPISSVNSRVLLSTPIALGNGGASNPYSVSTWFKGLYAFSETVHGWRTLIRGTTNNHHIILNKESNEIGTFRDAWFGSGQILSPISSESNWQHLVATFDGSKTTFYIDGNLLGSVQKSPGLDIKSIGNFQMVLNISPSISMIFGFIPKFFRIEKFLLFIISRWMGMELYQLVL